MHQKFLSVVNELYDVWVGIGVCGREQNTKKLISWGRPITPGRGILQKTRTCFWDLGDEGNDNILFAYYHTDGGFIRILQSTYFSMNKMMKKHLVGIAFLFFPVAGVFPQALLRADGPGDTYELITSVLAPGYSPLETPDCSHESFGRHIDEIMDSILNEYVFRFFIHVMPDNDRCINTDRQRNEIKVYANSPDSLKGFLGERMIYEWIFRLDSLFQPSYSFTHIHQLKAVGGSEDGMPLITLTPRKGSPDILQLLYAQSDNPETMATVPLSKICGRWIHVREEVVYDEKGSYELTLMNLADSSEILHYRQDTIRLWRNGASFVRPKWGIYRSLNHTEQLRDEEVLFNRFYICKVSSLSVHDRHDLRQIVIFPDPVQDNLHFDLPGEKMETPYRLYDITGRVVRANRLDDLHRLNVSFLPSGFYLLEIRKGSEIFRGRFIKK